jgi:hypothetical protein
MRTRHDQRSNRRPARRTPLECLRLEERTMLSSFVVHSTADDGEGSLRQAILGANGDSDPSSLIHFNFPGNGVQTIALDNPLPDITHPVTIDGYSQPGSSHNTLAVGDNAKILVELNGANVSFGEGGLVLAGGNSTVRGLAINRFGRGIMLKSGGNVIEGNFIGLDPSGLAATGNRVMGVAIVAGAGNLIGGTTPAARNVIVGSGNSNIVVSSTDMSPPEGHEISGTLIRGNYIGTYATGTTAPDGNSTNIYLTSGSGTVIGGTEPGAGNVICRGGYGILLRTLESARRLEDVTIQGNFIGVDATGGGALGSQLHGIDVTRDNGAPEIPLLKIGGTEVGAGNVISGNRNIGIRAAAHEMRIQGNLIGTDATGTKPLGPQGQGIVATVVGANGTMTIGGTTAAARNVISGNKNGGLLISQAVPIGSTSTIAVQGNFIGTQIDGTSPLGNGDGGIAVGGSSKTMIGGADPGAANVIAYNGGHGLFIYDGLYTKGVSVLSNSIHSNGDRGIAFGRDGANNNQNFPKLIAVTPTPTGTTIQGSLDSIPSSTFMLEFFANSVADPSGYGEGQALLGRTTVTTDSSGNATFSASVDTLPAGQGFVSATATSSTGDTSEFSGAFDATGDTGHSKAPTQTEWAPGHYISRFGQEVMLVVLVSSLGEATPAGTVTFTIDDVDQPPVALEPYLAGRSVARFVVTDTLSVGTHALSATFSGDDEFESSTSNAVSFQVIDLDQTTTELTTSRNPSTFGQRVTFTAVAGRRSGENDPSGTITFTIDGVAASPVEMGELGEGQLGATFVTALLSVGIHQVTATYSGDERFKSSASTVIVQMVNAVDPPPAAGSGPMVMSLARYGFHMKPTRLVLTFDQALDPTSAHDVRNYRLVGPGGRSIAIGSAVYDVAARTVTLRPMKLMSLQVRYTLTINGTSPAGLRGTSGQLLDGARTGRPGSDHKTAVLGKHLVIPKPIPKSVLSWLLPRRR